MKLKEVLEDIFENQYEQNINLEVYRPKFKNDDSHAFRFHTDFIDYTDDYTGGEEVITYKEMDADDYNNSILADTSENAEDYIDEGEHILCVLIEKESE